MTIPTITDDLIAEIEAAANSMQGWPNDASFKSDDAWCVGTVDEDGNLYPVVEIQVEQYDAEHFAEPMADYYATANPANILALISRIRELEKDAARYRWLREYENDCFMLNTLQVASMEDLDVAIDAAMKGDL